MTASKLQFSIYVTFYTCIQRVKLCRFPTVSSAFLINHWRHSVKDTVFQLLTQPSVFLIEKIYTTCFDHGTLSPTSSQIFKSSLLNSSPSPQKTKKQSKQTITWKRKTQETHTHTTIKIQNWKTEYKQKTKKNLKRFPNKVVQDKSEEIRWVGFVLAICCVVGKLIRERYEASTSLPPFFPAATPPMSPFPSKSHDFFLQLLLLHVHTLTHTHTQSVCVCVFRADYLEQDDLCRSSSLKETDSTSLCSHLGVGHSRISLVFVSTPIGITIVLDLLW